MSTRAAGILLAGLVGTLLACAPSPPATTVPSSVSFSPTPSTQPSPRPVAEPHEVRMGLTEWTIETSAQRFSPGTTRVVVTNTGATGHDLLIRGAAGVWATPVLPPGGRHELLVTAEPGETLEAVCTVSGHESGGMHRLLPVSGDPT